MRIIKPYIYVYETELNTRKLTNIEYSARLCYKSEENIKQGSYEKLLKQLIKRGHLSVIEHEKATVYFVVDRGVTHEIVRHRIGSYSQESTRYCNYQNDKFGNEITVIEPFFYLDDDLKYGIWKDTCLATEVAYLKLLNNGYPQEARSVLPNSLKTEIGVTFNFREWRHFFELRCAINAHPQMQQVAIPLLLLFKEKFAPIFDDIEYNREFNKQVYSEINVLGEHERF